jgi:hypothetical protein
MINFIFRLDLCHVDESQWISDRYRLRSEFKGYFIVFYFKKASLTVAEIPDTSGSIRFLTDQGGSAQTFALGHL